MCLGPDDCCGSSPGWDAVVVEGLLEKSLLNLRCDCVALCGLDGLARGVVGGFELLRDVFEWPALLSVLLWPADCI